MLSLVILFGDAEYVAKQLGNASPCVHEHLLTSVAVGALGVGAINLYAAGVDVLPSKLALVVLGIDSLGVLHYGRTLFLRREWSFVTGLYVVMILCGVLAGYRARHVRDEN